MRIEMVCHTQHNKLEMFKLEINIPIDNNSSLKWEESKII